jgi:tetratricopeptide (TPR) repeat protein
LDGAASGEVERQLRELERRELVRREHKSSVLNEVEYAFRHVLIRDVAYAQIPRAERSLRHRRAAQWIASLGRPEDHSELLAQHYLEALKYARAAGGDTGDFAVQALSALREAGERALALGSYQPAAAYFEAALGLVGAEDAQRGELLSRYGGALFWGTNSGEEVLEEAVRLLRPVDPEGAARAALLRARLEWTRGNRAVVLRWLSETDDLLAELPGDSIVRVEVLLVRSGLEMFAANHEEAIRLAQSALARVEDLDRPDLRARACDLIGTSRIAMGDEGGLEDQRRAIQIAREGHAIWELQTAQNNQHVAMFEQGFLATLDRNLEERRRTFKEIGSTAGTLAWFLAAEAHTHYAAGRWDAALGSIDRFLSHVAEDQTHYLEPDMRPLSALIAFARDGVAEALTEADRAVELGRRSLDPQAFAGSLCVRAFLLLANRRTNAALVDFEELLALGPGLTTGLNVSGYLPTFTWLAVDLGRHTDSERVLAGSRSLRWTAAARAILDGKAGKAADLLKEIGHRPAEAYAHLRAGGDHLPEALAFYRSVGATRYIREAESQLAASA